LLRAVLDANVYISAIIQPGGTPGKVLERFLSAASFHLVISPQIVDEVLRALAYPQLWFEDIVVLADLVAGAHEISRVSRDPDDDKYLAAAVEGRATHVVTGDQDLLSVGRFEDVEVVTPRAFLSLLGQ